jgi:hypothetical protein
LDKFIGVQITIVAVMKQKRLSGRKVIFSNAHILILTRPENTLYNRLGGILTGNGIVITLLNRLG